MSIPLPILFANYDVLTVLMKKTYLSNVYLRRCVDVWNSFSR